MNAGVGLVLTSKRATGPVGAGAGDEEEEEQATTASRGAAKLRARRKGRMDVYVADRTVRLRPARFAA
jgi:hypothetical protein